MILFIDDKEVDIDINTSVSISLSIASITQIETGKTGYSKTLQIPITAKNMAIMGDPEQINAVEMFNQTKHSARIEVGGSIVIEGFPMLTKCTVSKNGTGWYNLNIIGAGKEWVIAASETMMKDTQIDFQQEIIPSTIIDGWSSASPVKFLPVQRDTFSISDATLSKPVRIMTFSDYHPFINAKDFIESIAAQAGYTINSSFLNSDFFKSLFISGKYPEKEVQNIADKMGFLAKRFAPATATADRFGRVYADPFTPLSSIGNIVDSADPEEESEYGKLSDVFNTNNCFRKVDNRIAFYPTETVNVGFEYSLKYSSDYKIKNRSELTCFNSIYLDDMREREFKIANNNEDLRSKFSSGMEYLLIIFDHMDGNEYKFVYDQITNQNADLQNLSPSDYTTIELKNFSARCTSVGVEAGQNAINPRLYIKNTSGEYVVYDNDWALYYGYVTETGTVKINVKLRSAALPAKPSEPRYFDLIHFGGAEEGMQMTISNEIYLKPIFLPHPTEGDTVSFQQIAAHELRQIDMINGIKQMFNLYFYSDSKNKIIYIEPREQFYDKDTIVDWSNNMDLAKPIEIEELGADMSKTFTLRYQEGDGAVARWDESAKSVFGKWSTQILNLYAKEGEKTYYNPVFTPTINKQGEYPDAKAATLMQVGDRNRNGETPDSENLNFPPKIVRYMGMADLPDSQIWGWPSYGKNYPLAAFHHTQTEPFTLCFEDRDNLDGLHSYYDNNIEMYNSGKKITAYIHLYPEDVEAFIIPNELKHDFRALFKLRIQGEDILCRLEEICDYNPASNSSTKCIFLKNI